MVLLTICFLCVLMITTSSQTTPAYRVVPCVSEGRLNDPTNTSVFRNTRYLYFATEKVTSATAYCRCRNWNASLLKITSGEIQRHINENLPRIETDCDSPKQRSFYYIGLYLSHGIWMWPDRKILGTYRNWIARYSETLCDEPNGYNSSCFPDHDEAYYQNSTQIYGCEGSQKGKWFDKQDSSEWYFICERPEIQASTKTTEATTSGSSVALETTSVSEENVVDNANSTFMESLGMHSNTSANGQTVIKTTSSPYHVVTTRNKNTSPTSTAQITTETGSNQSDLDTVARNNQSSSHSIPTSKPSSPGSSSNTSKCRYGAGVEENIDECLSCLFTKKAPLNEKSCEPVFNRFSKAFDIKDWENHLSRSIARVLLNHSHEKDFVMEHFSDISLHLFSITSSAQLKELFEHSTNIPRSDKDFAITFNHENPRNYFIINKSELENIPLPFAIVASEIRRTLWQNNNLSSVSPAVSLNAISNENKNLEFNKIYRLLSSKSSILSLSVFVEGTNKHIIKTNISSRTVSNLRESKNFYQQLELQSGRNIPPKAVSHLCSFLKIDGTLEWSRVGCGVISVSDNAVMCGCNHTTSFATMFAIRTINVPNPILTAFVVLESISMVALALTLVLLLWLRKKIRNSRTFVQISLSFSLLLLHVCFVFGGTYFVKKIPKLCETFTVLTHFFTLSSAMWMLTEGIVLFIKTSKNSLSFSVKKKLPFLVLSAWGVPFVVVSISAGIGLSNKTYIDKQFSNEAYSKCWVGFDSHMIYSVIIPTAIIFCITSLIVIKVAVAIAKLSKNVRRMQPSGRRKSDMDVTANAVRIKKLPKRKNKTQIPTFSIAPNHASAAALKAVMMLLPVLGIPWFLSFLVNIENAEEIFLIIHGIVNGLQGVCIFYIYCIKNSQFRKSFDQKILQYNSSKIVGNSPPNSSRLSRGISHSNSNPKQRI